MDSDSMMSETFSQTNAFEDCKLFEIISDINEKSAKQLRKLLESGADIFARGSYDETYLHLVCAPIDSKLAVYVVPIVYQLVEAGLDVNAKDKEGNTPLHVCAINELDKCIITAFLRCGADPSSMNNYDQEPIDLTDKIELKGLIEYFKPGLSMTVKMCNLNTVKKLIDAWCVIDMMKINELIQSKELSHLAIYEHLEASKPVSDLIVKVFSGDSSKVKKMLKSDSQLNADLVDGYLQKTAGRKWTLLAEAVRLKLWDCAKELMKFTDVNQEITLPNGECIPACLWILKADGEPEISFIKAVLKKANISNLETVSVIYSLWKKGFKFSDLFEMFLNSGFVLSARDDEGLTIRDLILRDSYAKEPEEFKKMLNQVDRYIIQLAKDGKLEDLNQLLLDGYDYLLVNDSKGKSIITKAQKEGNTNIVEFLNSVPAKMKTMREMHEAIELGNFQKLKRVMDEGLLLCKDRGGRSLLHKAIIYERNYVIRYLLKTCPELVHRKDNCDRTPLHYAVCMEEADEMEEKLIEMGASEMEPDKNGYSPLEYKASEQAFEVMREERDKQYGGNVHLLQHYLDMVTAIKTDEKALTVALERLAGIPIDELNKVPETFKEVEFRHLLFICVENDQEDMALTLIEKGADYNIAAKHPNGRNEHHQITLLQAAEKQNHRRLTSTLRGKIVREDETIRSKLAMRSLVKQIHDANGFNSRMSDFSAWTSHSNSPPPAKKQYRSNHSSIPEVGRKMKEPLPLTRRAPNTAPAKPQEDDAQKSSTCTIL